MCRVFPTLALDHTLPTLALDVTGTLSLRIEAADWDLRAQAAGLPRSLSSDMAAAAAQQALGVLGSGSFSGVHSPLRSALGRSGSGSSSTTATAASVSTQMDQGRGHRSGQQPL